MSHTLSLIASVLAGVAILTTIFLPGIFTKSLAKGMAVSVSLVVLAAVLTSVARDYGS